MQNAYGRDSISISSLRKEKESLQECIERTLAEWTQLSGFTVKTMEMKIHSNGLGKPGFVPFDTDEATGYCYSVSINLGIQL